MTLLQRAAALEPDLAWVHRELGELFRVLNRPKEALAALDRALALEPESVFALGTRGQVLRMLDRTEEALADLEAAARLDPTVAWVQAELGEGLRAAGRHEDAVRVLDALLEQHPSMAFAWASKGAALRDLHRPAEARAAIERALELDPQYQWALGVKAALLNDIAEYESASGCAEAALALDPAVAWVWGIKGWALENQRPARLEEARRAYEEAARLAPMQAVWRKAIGDVLSRQGLPGPAAEAYRAALEIAAREAECDAGTYAVKGWCWFRLGDREAAMRELLEAVSQEPDAVSVQFDLGLVLLHDGRYGLAERDYRRGLDRCAARDPLEQRGLLHVALSDLDLSIAVRPDLGAVPEVQSVREALEAQLAAARRRAGEAAASPVAAEDSMQERSEWAEPAAGAEEAPKPKLRYR